MPVRWTAPGVDGGTLAAAVRDVAESGAATVVLAPVDGETVVAWANRAFLEIVEAEPGELVGRSLKAVSEDDPAPAAGAGAGSLPAPRPSEEPRTAPQPEEGRPPAAPDEPPAPTPGPEEDRPPVPVEPFQEPPAGWALTVRRLLRVGGGASLGVLRTSDGSHRQIRVDVAPIGTADALPPARLGVGRPGVVSQEVTAERDVEGWIVSVHPVEDAEARLAADLIAAEQRFAALARCAPIGIFSSGAGMRLAYVNDRFVSLTGLTVPSLLGTGWLDAIHPEDLAGVYAAVQSTLGGQAVELSVRVAGVDGEQQRWLQLRLAPTTAPDRTAGFIGTAEDVTRRRSWEEHLTYQAQHDPLTGLVNRRRLIEVLSELLSGRRTRDREFAVLFLDLDGFKSVNDTYGHDAGDRALIEVSRRMQRVVRDTDVLARVAGDEFVVVLRNILSEREAEAAARRHLAALAAPVHVGRASVQLSASVGVALPAGFDTPESLLKAADRMMYEAKAAGHGLYRLAPTSGETR